MFEFQSLYIELRICIRIRKLDIRNSIEIPDGSAYDLLDLGKIKGTEMENLIAEGWKKARKENVGANLGDFGDCQLSSRWCFSVGQTNNCCIHHSC